MPKTKLGPGRANLNVPPDAIVDPAHISHAPYKPRPYKHESKDAALYEQVEAVPDGLKWKPGYGGNKSRATVLYSLGNYYKLIRIRDTGAVTYYKLKDMGPPANPASMIDEEPGRQEAYRYNVGKHCWLVLDTGWFCCEVMKRGRDEEGRPTIVLRPTTGWDAGRLAPWPYGELLEFAARRSNPLFCRLRPLKSRQT